MLMIVLLASWPSARWEVLFTTVWPFMFNIRWDVITAQGSVRSRTPSQHRHVTQAQYLHTGCGSREYFG